MEAAAPSRPEVTVDDRLRLALADGERRLEVQLDRRTAIAVAEALVEFAQPRASLVPRIVAGKGR